MNDIFGPMSSNYCNIFLIFSALYLLVTILLLGGFLLSLTNKKVSFIARIYMFAGAFNYLLLYITHRIFYNMCRKTA